MKLTTMKISVPVLMLMMFQSGYGASDWFEKAWGLMNQGKKAEAYAVVQEAQPEKVGKLSTEQTTEFKKDWSKAVSDAVTNILPLYYADTTTQSGLTAAGDALRDAIVTLDSDGIVDGTVQDSLGAWTDQNSQDQITKDAVNTTLKIKVVTLTNHGVNAVVATNAHNWLLPSTDYLDDTKKGINKWVNALISDWMLEGDNAETNNKNLLTDQTEDSANDFALRKDIHLAGKNVIDGNDVGSVYDAIKNAGAEAKTADNSSDDAEKKRTKTELTIALRDALLDVLAERISDPEGANDDAKSLYQKTQLGYYISTYRDRVVTVATSETVIDYDDGNGGQHHDPLRAIVDEAGNTLSADNIKKAVDKVIVADFQHLLRHDNAILNAGATAALNKFDEDIKANGAVEQDKVISTLQAAAQTFDDATASSIVSNLKAIKTNQP